MWLERVGDRLDGEGGVDAHRVGHRGLVEIVEQVAPRRIKLLAPSSLRVDDDL
jgi:hypothetical protein